MGSTFRGVGFIRFLSCCAHSGSGFLIKVFSSVVADHDSLDTAAVPL